MSPMKNAKKFRLRSDYRIPVLLAILLFIVFFILYGFLSNKYQSHLKAELQTVNELCINQFIRDVEKAAVLLSVIEEKYFECDQLA